MAGAARQAGSVADLTRDSGEARIHRPDSVRAAWELSRRLGSEARLMAGGTLEQLGWAAAAMPSELIDLRAIQSPLLRSFSLGETELRIGALTTLAALIEAEVVERDFPLLAHALRQIASPAVRNLATIGGNLAGGIGCAIPALLALDAEIESFGESGYGVTPLAGWVEPGGLVLPQGIVTAIILPCRPPTVSCYEKIGLRQAFSPSVIGCAGALWTDETGLVSQARLAVGGGVNPVQRLAQAEAALLGRSIAEIGWRRLRDGLMEEIRPAKAGLRSQRYRKAAAANALVAGLGGAAALATLATGSSGAVAAPAHESAPPGQRRVSRMACGEEWQVGPELAEKIAGRLLYQTDRRLPDMLVGRILWAAHPHALIRRIDTKAAAALPGVAAVVTHHDVPGLNGYGIAIQDHPALCHDKVRYLGDVVAAVAAKDEQVAARALALIEVEYELLPVVGDPEAALQPGAARLHESGNLLRALDYERGDIDQAWPACAHVVEDIYVTPRQMHGFMETEGGYACPEPDGGVTVAVASQHTHRDRTQLARILAMDEARIRIRSSPAGGAFGGKDELSVQPVLALLALKSGRPVRLQLTRAESVVSGIKRLPMRIRMRTGCDASGRLLAQQTDLLADGGAYASLGGGVIETALEHVCGSYRIPHVRSRARLAYTNNGVGGAFRGFGANEMNFAVECQMGRLAALAGLDPIAFRRLNLRHPGDPGHHGQALAPSDRSRESLRAAAASDLWRAERGVRGRQAIGVGIALAMAGNGLGSALPDPGGGRLALAADGMIDAAFGLVEIGQGVLGVIRASVAQALGCGRADVRPILGDTGCTPDSGSTTASRGTQVGWHAAQRMAPGFRDALLAAAAGRLGRRAEDLAIGPGGIYESRRNRVGEPLLSFAALAAGLGESERPQASCAFEFAKSAPTAGNARYIFCYGAAVARVAVDRVTGAIALLDLDHHTAAGPVLDAAGYLGQLEGAAVQAQGFTLTEDVRIADGRFLTGNFDGYMMPTSCDAPARMRVFAIEDLDPGDDLGPRGVGELGIGMASPAIAAAIADAVGIWMSEAPFDPEKLLAGLGALPEAVP